MIKGTLLQDGKWIPFLNKNAGTIPAYGIVRKTDYKIIEPGRGVLWVDQPNAFGCQDQHFVNFGRDVAPNSYGQCSRIGLLPALYDSGTGTPADGQCWGPTNASWKLSKNTGGWLVYGDPTNTDMKLCVVTSRPMTEVKVKTIGAHAKGATQACDIWVGTEGAEAAVNAGTVQLTCYNRFADLGAGKWARASFNWDTNKFELVDGEC